MSDGKRKAREALAKLVAEFGELARALADRIAAEYRPDVVLGIVNGGVFLGGALAAPLGAEFHPLRVGRIGKRVVVIDRLGDLRGKAVLIADDVTASGKTLASVAQAARRAGARETRTATLVVRPTANRSDFHALDTTDVIVFGWDYQLHGGAGGGDPGDVGV
jgi:hypoxanthine phosphoribosyltransferase